MGGRTITPNSAGGTDHAWGNNHFICGGALHGGRVQGKYPDSLLEGSPLDVGRGRIIPEYSWESMWHPLASWFGINEQQMSYVLPNWKRFEDKLIPKDHMFNPNKEPKDNGCKSDCRGSSRTTTPKTTPKTSPTTTPKTSDTTSGKTTPKPKTTPKTSTSNTPSQKQQSTSDTTSGKTTAKPKTTAKTSTSNTPSQKPQSTSDTTSGKTTAKPKTTATTGPSNTVSQTPQITT